MDDRKLPVLWILTGPKAGDNAQILRAAEATGLEYDVKKIVIAKGHETKKPRVRPTLRYVDADASDVLEPPWPDVVLTIGRQLSLVALWIKKQSAGRTRVALFNAPKGKSDAFDLVVLPPFYRTTPSPSVLVISMPLIGIEPHRLAAARIAYREQFADLPRPLHVFLVGGDMGRRKLDPGFASSVLERMQKDFAAIGSIFVSTSRRTPLAVSSALAAGLRPQDRLFRWGTVGVENPYLGLLAHGDTFTVTADSLSMIIEAARLGKPLMITEPPPLRGVLGLADRALDMFRVRDLGKAINMLYESGHATPIGQAIRTPSTPLPDDVGIVADRLLQLL
jgi:mitochondrial fission protein ELM1